MRDFPRLALIRIVAHSPIDPRFEIFQGWMLNKFNIGGIWLMFQNRMSSLLLPLVKYLFG
ncbi:hypothetical protein OIU78_027389 [Salix suchowensis]|nr:hypothetical protein OIU78_027389 [Salix suchowensis]